MTDREIAATYDRAAEGYARHVDGAVYQVLAAPLVRALDGLDGRVLDVASGTGALGRRFRRAVAVDLAHGQLARNPLRHRVRADAVALPFPADAFAAAVSAFGINHPASPLKMVVEMARVAPVVGLLTWARPAPDYAPKRIVLEVTERHAGHGRSPAGRLVGRRTDAVGSERALRELLEGAGLEARVRTVPVDVPWPGTAAFVEYRLWLMDVISFVPDPDAVRREAAAAIDALPPEALAWRSPVVLGVGRRR